MNNWLMINTRGDPLGAFRELVKNIWEQGKLDGMLVPINEQIGTDIKPQVIHDSSRLEAVNPFKPLMSSNASKYIPELVDEYSKHKLGALLRPCEMRALIEMSKRNKFSTEKLVTISIDCLGTYPADEFSWRASRKGSSGELTKEQLKFARQGGIMAYRYRSACQLCVSPNAHGADINIGIMGLPVREKLIISAKNKSIQDEFNLEIITDGLADSLLVNQRDRLLAKLEARRDATRERVTQGIVNTIPANIEDLIAHLEECGDCKDCLDICPICAIDYPQRAKDGHYQPEDIKRWMVSCAGCGMCEQVCPQHQPLNLIFSHIQRQLSKEYGYMPGASPDQLLPIFV